MFWKVSFKKSAKHKCCCSIPGRYCMEETWYSAYTAVTRAKYIGFMKGNDVFPKQKVWSPKRHWVRCAQRSHPQWIWPCGWRALIVLFVPFCGKSGVMGAGICVSWPWLESGCPGSASILKECAWVSNQGGTLHEEGFTQGALHRVTSHPHSRTAWVLFAFLPHWTQCPVDNFSDAWILFFMLGDNYSCSRKILIWVFQPIETKRVFCFFCANCAGFSKQANSKNSGIKLPQAKCITICIASHWRLKCAPHENKDIKPAVSPSGKKALPSTSQHQRTYSQRVVPNTAPPTVSLSLITSRVFMDWTNEKKHCMPDWSNASTGDFQCESDENTFQCRHNGG